MKPKLLLVSRGTTEWCTRCMSGVTTIQRSTRSSRAGRRTLPWLNIEVALSSTSKMSTATAGAPSAATTPSLITIDSRISIGWKRSAGGHVELEVGVVHAVQPPQHRHGMEQHVLQVDGEVEEDHRGDDGEPGRRVESLEQAPAVRLGEKSHADRGSGKTSRTSSVSSTTMPRLLGQRHARPIF